MQIPNLPTDNLYKFATVAGVFLFVVGLVAPFYMDQTEMEWYWDQRQSINDRMMEKIKFLAEVQLREDLDPKTLQNVQEVMNESLASIQETEVDVLARRIDERSAMVFWRAWTLRLSLWLGVLFFVGGIVMWWFRFQRIQDAMLRAELRKLEGEITEAMKEAK